MTTPRNNISAEIGGRHWKITQLKNKTKISKGDNILT